MNSAEPKQKIVYDLIEARQHFSQSKAEPILCVRRDNCGERMCATLEEARSFLPATEGSRAMFSGSDDY